MGQETEVEVTWNQVFAVWWLILWRSLVGALALSFIVGFVLGFLLGVVGFEQADIPIVTGAAGGLVGLAWGIIVIKMALAKRYSGFRIVLVPTAIEPRTEANI